MWISRTRGDDEHDVPAYQRPESLARPLCAAKRESYSRFLNSHPLPGGLLKAPMLSPPARGEGEDWEWGRKPRVPLALHPGLLIFRPYRGLDIHSDILTPGS